MLINRQKGQILIFLKSLQIIRGNGRNLLILLYSEGRLGEPEKSRM